MSRMQVIVTTSDSSLRVLPGFARLFNLFWSQDQPVTICGFTKPDFPLPDNFHFVSLGRFEDYPVNRWSDAMLKIIDTVAEEVFALLLDDYWPIRYVDQRGVKIAYDYMGQFKNVVKFDLCRERLWNDPGGYTHEANTYAHAGHLDLIKSRPHSPYHMSLWAGLWRRDLLRMILVPGESAQQIEINGTVRLSSFGDHMLVMGSRQAPLLHGNILISRNNGRPVFADTGWQIAPGLLDTLRKEGLLQGLE